MFRIFKYLQWNIEELDINNVSLKKHKKVNRKENINKLNCIKFSVGKLGSHGNILKYSTIKEIISTTYSGLLWFILKDR